MDKEQLNESNIGRFITLNNQLSYIDPYVLKKTKEIFLEENQYKLKKGNLLIFVLTHKKEDIGFIKFQCKNKNIFIDKLFVKKNYRDFEAYEMLLNINDIFTENRNFKSIKYIGVNDKPRLIDALKFHGFFMEKEHIQMEKILSDKHENKNFDLFKKSFHEVKDKKWIYNFMKECMIPVKFNYSYEEIIQITKDSDDLKLIFYKENKPLGFIIAHINEQRNKQQNKKVIYIEEVGIFKRFRNKGYGKQIIKFIINKGEDKGMELARLHVYRDNEVAYKIYKKLGFSKVKSIGHWINRSF